MMIGVMVQIVAMMGSTEAHILLVHFLNNRSYTGLSTSLSNRDGLFPKREVADLLSLIICAEFPTCFEWRTVGVLLLSTANLNSPMSKTLSFIEDCV